MSLEAAQKVCQIINSIGFDCYSGWWNPLLVAFEKDFPKHQWSLIDGEHYYNLTVSAK